MRLAVQSLAVLAALPAGAGPICGAPAPDRIALPGGALMMGAAWRWPEGPGSDLSGRLDHPVVHIAYEDEVFEWGAAPSPGQAPQPRANTWQGTYGWRSWLTVAVVGGYSPSVIPPDTPTVAQFLKEEGYQTAMVGKWHLGWGDDDGDLTQWATGFTIFSSDNGGVDHAYLSDFGHKTNGSFRGQKSELYEGGHRVPFIVSWPGIMEPDRRDELVMMTDVYPTIADVLGVTLETTEAIDDQSCAPLLGLSAGETRDYGVMHSLLGTGAVREGWLPEPPRESYRLYDLEADPPEASDLAEQYPDIVDRLASRLAEIRAAEVSRREVR